MNLHAALAQFHDKFGFDEPTKPTLLDKDFMEFRVQFLHEELEELQVAVDEDNLPEIADALVDLVYVAIGTAELMGLPFNDLFAEVHGVNMTKERAIPKDSRSKRNAKFDVVKPVDFQPPQISAILERAAYDRQNILRSFALNSELLGEKVGENPGTD